MVRLFLLDPRAARRGAMGNASLHLPDIALAPSRRAGWALAISVQPVKERAIQLLSQ